MKKTIVLATRNAGKVRELAHVLAAHGLEVVGLDAFADMEDVEETGTTFAENALLKANAVAQYTKLVAIADDSGLEVDALQKAPGVYSARYGADWPLLPEESKDARNNRKLLSAMMDVPQEKRTARFVCCMAACKPDGEHVLAHGMWEGRILTTPVGTNGFGYDPVFLDEVSGRSAAELTRDEKQARSHRGKAVAALLEKLVHGFLDT